MDEPGIRLHRAIAVFVKRSLDTHPSRQTQFAWGVQPPSQDVSTVEARR
ncbi:hypothetical protein C7S13_8251 [Burkholderia cepacia]|nr:hypothetical protein [Burkholderia cepacia]